MKKVVIFSVIIMFCFASIVIAAPYLVSDTQNAETIQGYQITWDGGATWEECGHEIDGNQIRVSHDLTAVETGTHEIMIKALNLWGDESDSTPPFLFRRESPTLPTNIRLSSNP